MSKHFELMQQLETNEEVGPDRTVQPAFVNSGASYKSSAHFQSANDEALRLVQRLFLLQTQKPPQVVIFAGIDHGNGCSGICGAVAEALATNSRGPVCVVDANFRSPALASLFGTAHQQGLTDALLTEAPIKSFTHRVANRNLWLIPSGGIAEDSPNLLSSDRLKVRLAELRAGFDFVVIDAPPLTRYADAIALGQMTDGLILIIEADSTKREAAQAVAANLRASNIDILAAVLNKRTFPIPQKIYKGL